MSRSHLRDGDFDLHGIVGIRVVDATEHDLAAVRRQIGPVERPLEREPDIVVRFVDRLARDSRMRFIGLDDVGFTDDGLFVLRGRHQAAVRVRIPFDRIGDRCEIVCERGLSAIPYLVAIVNLTALARGHVPLHAAAFVHDGLGVLVTGWSKVGKTETLLGFLALGAEYLADEWLYVDPTSGAMAGLPEPMRIWDWQLRAVSGVTDLVPGRTRARLRTLRAATDLMRRIEDVRGLGGSTVGRTLGRARPLLERQLSIQIPPAQLFGGRIRTSAQIDRIVFVVSAERADVAVEPIDAEHVARRSGFSTGHERLDLEALYLKFRYAFPDAVNPWLERAAELEQERLISAFGDRPAMIVEHPYPPDIHALAKAIEQRLR
jgi:hypothetical protein